jgi:hypothetical protein
MSQISQRTKARVRQQALRSMCCGADGKLHKNARVVLAHLRDFCGADGRPPPVTIRPEGKGAIDPLALAMAEGRRQVFDHIARMLAVTLEDRHNLEDNLS